MRRVGLGAIPRFFAAAVFMTVLSFGSWAEAEECDCDGIKGDFDISGVLKVDDVLHAKEIESQSSRTEELLANEISSKALASTQVNAEVLAVSGESYLEGTTQVTGHLNVFGTLNAMDVVNTYGEVNISGPMRVLTDTIIEVDIRGGRDYRTIQAAIDSIPSVGEGSPSPYHPFIIQVYPGIYEIEQPLVIDVPWTIIRGMSRRSVVLQPTENIGRLDGIKPAALIEVEGNTRNSGLASLTVDVDPDGEGAKYTWPQMTLRMRATASQDHYSFDGFSLEDCTFLGGWDWDNHRERVRAAEDLEPYVASYKTPAMISVYTDNSVVMDGLEIINCTFRTESDQDILRLEGSVGVEIKDSYFHGYASSTQLPIHGYRGAMIRMNPMAKSECRLAVYRSLFQACGRGIGLYLQSGNPNTTSASFYATDFYGFDENISRAEDVRTPVSVEGKQ